MAPRGHKMGAVTFRPECARSAHRFRFCVTRLDPFRKDVLPAFDQCHHDLFRHQFNTVGCVRARLARCLDHHVPVGRYGLSRLTRQCHPLGRQLDHVRQERPADPPALELHQHDDAGRRPVRPVKLGDQVYWPGHTKHLLYVEQFRIEQRRRPGSSLCRSRLSTGYSPSRPEHDQQGDESREAANDPRQRSHSSSPRRLSHQREPTAINPNATRIGFCRTGHRHSTVQTPGAMR
ncbi:hypothetical protein BH11PSE8_BH11PSE8_24460 [soil metagenome]